jgi:hypothetical protein
MSHRVKRRLPTSFLGRTFLTWLYPGPASGYMFVIANTSAVAVLMLFGVWISQAYGMRVAARPSVSQILYAGFTGWAYIIAYLGLGSLVIAGLRRVATVQMTAAVLIQLLLILAGSGIPSTVQLMNPRLRLLDYSYLQITNPFWTLSYVGDIAPPGECVRILILVSVAATCVLLLNLPRVGRELSNVRMAPPSRVLEDELELHPPAPPRPTNPWDDGQSDESQMTNDE